MSAFSTQVNKALLMAIKDKKNVESHFGALVDTFSDVLG